MSEFNPQISLEEIPKVEDIDFRPLEKSYLKVQLIANTVLTMILTLIFVGSLVFIPEPMPPILFYIILILFVIRTIWSYISRIKGFRHKAYALRKKDIVYKKGWLWRSLTTAPFNRIQHVRIDRGVIERKMNLAKLKIYTAGGNSSDMTIPGLLREDAQNIKQFIVRQISEDEEE